MDGVVDLAESRKARNEKSETVREASKELLMLLERQRPHLPEEFMTFLLAMAVSDQAIDYTEKAGDKKAGLDFIENLFITARQLFETYYPNQIRAVNTRMRSEKASGQLVQLAEKAAERADSDSHLPTPLE